jgi:hypothetical protein
MNIDVIYTIGLYVNFKRSIAIIGSCKALWERRKLFYIEKQNGKEINLWTPERNYYASCHQFIFGASYEGGCYVYGNDKHIKVTEIYDYNNATKHLLEDMDYVMIFNITHRYIVIYYSKQHRMSGLWETELYHKIQDVHMSVENKIQDPSYRYVVFDLKHSILGYMKFDKVEAYNCIINL